PAARYGIEGDLERYPQASPKEALSSVLKAIDHRKIDYLLAQLSDPEFVDKRVQKVHGGKFEGLVEETAAKLANDPGEVKKLRRFIDGGRWKTKNNTATATLKDVPEHVYFRNIGGRWFLENQHRPKAETKDKQ